MHPSVLEVAATRWLPIRSARENAYAFHFLERETLAADFRAVTSASWLPCLPSKQFLRWLARAGISFDRGPKIARIFGKTVRRRSPGTRTVEVMLRRKGLCASSLRTTATRTSSYSIRDRRPGLGAFSATSAIPSHDGLVRHLPGGVWSARDAGRPESAARGGFPAGRLGGARTGKSGGWLRQW